MPVPTSLAARQTGPWPNLCIWTKSSYRRTGRDQSGYRRARWRSRSATSSRASRSRCSASTRSKSASCTRSRPARCAASRRFATSPSSPPGRVLRHRRAQRDRQEHAAEDPRRHLPRRRRDDPRWPGGSRRSSSSASASTPTSTARDNVILNGDHARPHAASEARERFDAVIEFAELEEFVDLKLKNYSSGMLRAARVLGHDPGRRRHPADRRGAGGRRRRLPAEVLRRVPRDARRRPHDRASSPTT